MTKQLINLHGPRCFRLINSLFEFPVHARNKSFRNWNKMLAMGVAFSEIVEGSLSRQWKRSQSNRAINGTVGIDVTGQNDSARVNLKRPAKILSVRGTSRDRRSLKSTSATSHAIPTLCIKKYSLKNYNNVRFYISRFNHQRLHLCKIVDCISHLLLKYIIKVGMKYPKLK